MTKILHVSRREQKNELGAEDFDTPRVMLVNIVVQASTDEDTRDLKQYSEQYVRDSLWEVDDPQKITDYYLNQELVFETSEAGNYAVLVGEKTPPEFDISDKRRTGYGSNDNNIFNKEEKFNIYTYREYIEINAITISAMLRLHELMAMPNHPTLLYEVIKAIKVLDLYYD